MHSVASPKKGAPQRANHVSQPSSTDNKVDTTDESEFWHTCSQFTLESWYVVEKLAYGSQSNGSVVHDPHDQCYIGGKALAQDGSMVTMRFLADPNATYQQGDVLNRTTLDYMAEYTFTLGKEKIRTDASTHT